MLAIRNLLRNPIRSGLTILGVSMGIAMLVSVSGYSDSIGSQLHSAVTNRYQLVVMSSGARSPLSSNIAASDLSLIHQSVGIAETQPIIIGSTRTDQIPFFLVLGVGSATAMAGNISLMEGRWFGSDESGIILGYSAAGRLRVGLGDQLDLRGRRFDISGIYSSPSNILNHGGVVSIAQAQTLLGYKDRYNAVFVKLEHDQGIKTSSRDFNQNFPHLQMLRTVDLLGSLEFFVVVERVTGALSLIAAVFCVLITMNTLLMSLAERRREIGILMAIGWSRFMIARSLVLEALIISLSGAVFGIILGLAVIYHYSQSDIPRINWGAPELSPEFVFVVMGLAVLVALTSVVYPLLLASRMSPAQILHRE